ncbi:MAG: PAS domain S-box protein, partial [Chloroflexi bacterium]|nr:PAS domain S-box protein [Chloroflexota bacterium]
RSMAETAIEGIYQVDAAGDFIFVNDAYAKILGYSPNELLGKHHHIIIPDESIEDAVEITTATTSGQPHKGEFALKHRLGHLVPAYFSMVALECSGQEPGFTGIIHDITERKQAETALQDSEERYRSMAETAIEGIYQVDAAGDFIFVNDAYAKILGYSPNELLGKHHHIIIPDENIEDAIEITTATTSGQPQKGEFALKHRLGHLVPAYFSMIALECSGQEPGFAGIIHDITERKQAEQSLRESEERFRGVIENSSDAILLLDENGTVRYESPAYELMLGYTAKDGTSGGLYEPVHPDDLHIAEAGFAEMAANPAGKTSRCELRFQHKGGTWLTLHIVANNLLGNPAVQGYVIHIRNITERKKAEEALRYRVQFENLISTLSTNFINLDPEEVDSEINRALKTIGEFASVDRSYVSLFDRDPSNMSITHECCAEGIEPQIQDLQGISIEPLAWSMNILQQLNNLHIPRVADLPTEAAMERELFQSQDIKSAILVPMAFGGFFMGFLGFDSVRSEISWSDDSIKLLRMAGDIFANALMRKRAEEVLQQAYAEVEQRVVERTAELAESNRQLQEEITERKRTEEALRESEEKYRMLVDNSATPVTYYTVDGQILFVNTIGAKNLGGKPEDFIGKSIAEVLPELTDVMTERIHLIVKHGTKTDYETLVSIPSGDRWFLSNLQPITDASGKVFAIQAVSQDITERKKAQEALQASEERFRSITENAHDVIVLVSMEGKTLYASPSIERVTGYTAENRTNNAFMELAHPDDIPAVEKNFARLASNPGSVESFELRLQHKDGSWRWVEGIAKNFLDDPSVQAIVGNYRDITDRKQSEEALQKSEESYKELFASTIDGLFVIESEAMTAILVNETAAKLFGFDTAEEAIGSKPLEFVHHEDRDRVLQVIAEDVFEKHLRDIVECRMITKDGRKIWVEAVGTKIEYQGRMAGLISFRNITGRKWAEKALQEAEEKWTALVNNTLATILVISIDGIILSINRAYPGHAMDDVVGTSCYDYLPLKHQEKAKKLLEEVFEYREARRSEAIIMLEEGERTWLDISITPMKEFNRVTAAIYITTDITDRKRSERQLQQHATELRRANEELAQYAEVTSHDICTPLRAIRYYTHLLRKDMEDTSIDDPKGYLNTIDSAVFEGEELAQNLLALSRVGQSDLCSEKVDTGALLEKIITAAGLPEDVEVTKKKEWPVIDADPTLLGQIFRNLIDNAVKFNSSPHKRIELNWELIENDSYEFTVKDNGIGISPRNHEEIFNVFRQLHHRSEYQGTGIGLSIVKKAASKLGGSVRVKSRAGRGSTFVVTIPKHPEQAQSDPAPKPDKTLLKSLRKCRKRSSG